MAEPTYKLASGEFCGAPFAVEPDGCYGICESFGPHDRHGGVVHRPGQSLYNARHAEQARRTAEARRG